MSYLHKNRSQIGKIAGRGKTLDLEHKKMGDGGTGVAADDPQPFTKGSNVEVNSDEEGFNGAWHEAIVLDPPSSSISTPKRKVRNRPDSVHVQYKSLLADEEEVGDGPVLLREHVELDFVRPSPPDTRFARPFQLNDAVDAYYKDGWWAGVISKVLGDSRYVVTFQNPTDEIECGVSDLRLHYEWIDGNWYSSREAAGLMFSMSKSVEVAFTGQDFQDVWFPADLVEDLGNGSFLVEYQSSRIGDASVSIPQKFSVNSLHIRPLPPKLKVKSFALSEKVDAFYYSGWRSGVIYKKLADSKYIVSLMNRNMDAEFIHSELRPHMEWKNGKWLSNSRRIKVDKKDNQTTEAGKSKVGQEKSQVRSPGKEGNIFRSPDSLKQDYIQNNVGLSVIIGLGCPRTRVPSIKRPHWSLDERSPKLTRDQKRLLSDPEIHEEESRFETGESYQKRKGRPPEPLVNSLIASTIHVAEDEVPLKNWARSGKRQRNIVVPVCSENSTRLIIKEKLKSGSSKQTKKTSTSKMTPPNAAKAQAENFGQTYNKQHDRNSKRMHTRRSMETNMAHTFQAVGALDIRKELEMAMDNLPSAMSDDQPLLMWFEGITSPTPIDGSSTTMQHSNHVVQNRKDILKQSPAPIDGSSTTMQHSSHVVQSQKDILKQSPAPIDGSSTTMQHSNDVVQSQKDILKQSPAPIDGSSTTMQHSNDVVQSQKDILKQSPAPIDGSSTTMQHSNDVVQSQKDILKQSPAPIDESSTTMQQSNDVVQSQRNILKQSPAPIDGSSTTMQQSNDVVQSQRAILKQSPVPIDWSSTTMQQSNDVVQSQKDIIEQSPAVDTKGEDAPGENLSLPFVKNTILWKTIESMEVFQRMAQKPHFRPLDGHKEFSREGLAIGTMLIFANIVQSASRLQIGDSESTIKDRLETLSELETHGFDVRVVRDRLTRLLSIKDGLEQLQDQKEELGCQIRAHNLELAQVSEDLNQIDKQIRDLQERRVMIMSNKETEISCSRTLQLKLDDINRSLASNQRYFERVAGAPW